jgi:hypothetical protein
MSKIISIRLDDRTASELRTHASARGLGHTQAARDLIRRGLGVVSSSYDAGFEEGKMAAYHEYYKRLNGVEVES